MYMDEYTWILIGGVILIGLMIGGHRWWRHRQAGKLADELLRHVIKGKNAIRR